MRSVGVGVTAFCLAVWLSVGCGSAGVPSGTSSTPIPIELPSNFAMPSALSIGVDEVTDTANGNLAVEKSTDKTLPGENALAQGLYQTDQDNAQLDAILAHLAAVTAEASTSVTSTIGTTANGGVWFADFTDFSFPTLTSSISGIDCTAACSGNTGEFPICVRITVGGKRVWYGKMTSPVTSTSRGAGCFYTFSTVTDASTEAALFDGTESHLIVGTWDFTDSTSLKLDMISATTTADSSGILNSGTRAVLTETSASSASINSPSGKSIGSATRTANVNGTLVDNGESKTVTVIDRWNAATIRATQTITGSTAVNVDGCFITGTVIPTGDCLTIDDVILVEQFSLPTVAAVASPPSVTGTSPVDGATAVMLNSSATVTFSETMDGSSITASTFKLTDGSGAVVNGTITIGDDATTAILMPTTLLTASTTYTGTVTTGVTDTGGTPPSAPYTWSFTTGTEVDTKVPSIASTSPVNGATRVAVNAQMTATFSEAMDSSTVTTSSFTVRPTAGGAAVSAAVDYSGTTATLTPTGNLSYSTSYTATISTAVKDTAGNALTAAASWELTTIAESGHYNPQFSGNGWYDESFSTTGDGFDSLQSVVVQSDGKIVAVGTAYNGTDQDVLVVRFNADGSLDWYDLVDLVGGGDFGQGVALQSDDKIVVSVWASNSDDTERNFAVLRYTTSGALDPTYGGGDGIALVDFNAAADTDTQYDLVINPSDQAILCGQIGGRAGLARYDTNGDLDTTFATNGTYSDADFDFFFDCAMDSDGKIVAVGEDQTFDTPGQDIAIARFSAAGALDTSFSVDGRNAFTVGSASNEQGLGVAIQSDGQIVIVGQTDNNSTSNDCVLARYGTTGTLDADFGSSGIFQFGNDAGGELQDLCYDVAIHSGGRIVVIGSSTGDALLARVTSSGTLNTTFDSDGLAVFTEAGGGTGLALDSNEDYIGVGSVQDGGTDTFIFSVIQ
ncbi:MAG: Ig-like domain-containing protein [Deltaproteobacteria bacterium]|nr:Ig-like domain-containing protein [Deltaproteobacteria bacterium]